MLFCFVNSIYSLIYTLSVSFSSSLFYHICKIWFVSLSFEEILQKGIFLKNVLLVATFSVFLFLLKRV